METPGDIEVVSPSSPRTDFDSYSQIKSQPFSDNKIPALQQIKENLAEDMYPGSQGNFDNNTIGCEESPATLRLEEQRTDSKREQVSIDVTPNGNRRIRAESVEEKINVIKFQVPSGVRKNGFGFPLHPQQLLMWFMVIFDTGTYYGINMVSLSGNQVATSIASTIYFMVGISAIISMYFVQKIDPTDPMVYKERELKTVGRHDDFDFSSFPLICCVCETHVSEQSKHCGSCQRCTANFDHHCKWANNCVGGANYRSFIALIVSFFFMSLTHNITNVAMLIHFFTGTCHVIETHEDQYGQTLFIEFSVLLIIAIVLNLIPMIFLGDLIMFHINLKRKGMTTYEWIKKQQDIQIRKSSVYILAGMNKDQPKNST